MGRLDPSNQAAVKASREYAAKNAPVTTFSQEPHAQDFMAYAYLQLGQNREPSAWSRLGAITKFSGARNYGRDTGQALRPSVMCWNAPRGPSARPAGSDGRLCLRPGHAALRPRRGRPRLGKPDVAKEEIAHLQAAEQGRRNSYWAEQVQVLVLAATAVQARAEDATTRP
jgi:hypothetical protein